MPQHIITWEGYIADDWVYDLCPDLHWGTDGYLPVEVADKLPLVNKRAGVLVDAGFTELCAIKVTIEIERAERVKPDAY